MKIIISVLVIILVSLFLLLMRMYNRLIFLQVNKENALNDMARDLDKLFDKLHNQSKKEYKKAVDSWTKASTIPEKIEAFNLLSDDIDTIENSGAGKFLETTRQQRRYYNHTTKKLNALLASFPSNILGNILGYKNEPLFILTSKEKMGETPAVKR